MSDKNKVVARNRKARHEYHIEETYEAGIVLQGTEVKSIRQGRVNLKDSFAIVESGELLLYNMHIAPYSHGNRYNHEPERPRKLLMHKKEIRRFIGKTRESGYTLIPLSVYFKRNLVKIELALAKGKNLHDKREDIKRRTAQREIERAFKDEQLNRY
ncbi:MULTISPECIES: SsrA-binding protein SmpB [unclassified Candidatus Frackibacter]|uniref:SsrA-binding protein SmpB n=1 Tax=unclassified Candidatus Frackibacter TaxID=2648818 RepID=UPI0007960126|nr:MULTISPECIES: SsrA-binding protein SmpB [unclassified Candidatus Frackibacter]KXS41420.1 MAG: SsrA-binding protein [Candidatus Frackibacter sp. T328-2]SDC70069.1 SsrA-binding protein [Candidatus Frackibacter sp. WG11]SEM85411.1 SsrA-binding protein [Candidatus Frackibacter sp. WG12]SFL94594.1 SsrA-binding protein [Candidatus Frackibacter sp. WG13]